MKKFHLLPELAQREKNRDARQSNRLVFCEKNTGVAQFQTESDPAPDGNVERTASLLAMQCLVRGQVPGDFVVLVPAERTLVARVISRAQELLEAGRAASCPTSLSPRQKEVLHGVLRHRANKEIATQLNISERTVKFHVSALLAKFRVETRSELARTASGTLQPATLPDESGILRRAPDSHGNQMSDEVIMNAAVRRTGKARVVRLQRRELSA